MTPNQARIVHRLNRLLLLLLFVLALLACAGQASQDSPTTETKPVIKLIENPWVAAELNVAVAKILLEEQLGYPVEVIEATGAEQWQLLAEGTAHASLEVWPSSHKEAMERYFGEEKSVEDGGPLGVIGKVGWYVPTYVVAANPALATWEGYQDPTNTALFKANESDGQGLFLAGDPAWGQYDAEIIENLGLALEVVSTGSEEALLAEVDEAYNAHRAVLFYFWTPHSAQAKYNLTEVALPPYSEACYTQIDAGGVDCDYPAGDLFKAFWPGLQAYAPDAYHLLKAFQYDNPAQIAMLAAVDLEGKSVEEAARTWIEQSEGIWRSWLPQ